MSPVTTPFQLNQALGETDGLGRNQFHERCRRHRRPSRRRTGLHHPLEFAVLQAQGLGRAENPMLPSRFRRCRTQRLWNRQARLVSFSPALETPLDPPHADGNLRRLLGGHSRSSSPLPGVRPTLPITGLRSDASLPEAHDAVPVGGSLIVWRFRGVEARAGSAPPIVRTRLGEPRSFPVQLPRCSCSLYFWSPRRLEQTHRRSSAHERAEKGRRPR